MIFGCVIVKMKKRISQKDLKISLRQLKKGEQKGKVTMVTTIPRVSNLYYEVFEIVGNFKKSCFIQFQNFLSALNH